MRVDMCECAHVCMCVRCVVHVCVCVCERERERERGVAVMARTCMCVCKGGQSPAREEPGVRASVEHGHAEALCRPDHDVRAELCGCGGVVGA